MLLAKIIFAILLTLSICTLDTNGKCDHKTLALYEVQFDTFWNANDFPKHYPQWRPPASWSKMLGKLINKNHEKISNFIAHSKYFYLRIGFVKKILTISHCAFEREASHNELSTKRKFIKKYRD